MYQDSFFTSPTLLATIKVWNNSNNAFTKYVYMI